MQTNPRKEPTDRDSPDAGICGESANSNTLGPLSDMWGDVEFEDWSVFNLQVQNLLEQHTCYIVQCMILFTHITYKIQRFYKYICKETGTWLHCLHWEEWTLLQKTGTQPIHTETGQGNPWRLHRQVRIHRLQCIKPNSNVSDIVIVCTADPLGDMYIVVTNVQGFFGQFINSQVGTESRRKSPAKKFIFTARGGKKWLKS